MYSTNGCALIRQTRRSFRTNRSRRASFDQRQPNSLRALLVAVPRARAAARRERGCPGGHVCHCSATRLRIPHRPSATERQRALSAYPDRALCDVETTGRLAVRSMDASPRATRSQCSQMRGTVAPDHLDSQRLAGLDWPRVPESGTYWLPGGLATVSIDRSQDRGLYFEPNVWMHHRL